MVEEHSKKGLEEVEQSDHKEEDIEHRERYTTKRGFELEDLWGRRRDDLTMDLRGRQGCDRK